MLYHDRIDISDGIHIVESNKSKERILENIVFLMMDSNFIILSAMVLMI